VVGREEKARGFRLFDSRLLRCDVTVTDGSATARSPNEASAAAHVLLLLDWRKRKKRKKTGVSLWLYLCDLSLRYAQTKSRHTRTGTVVLFLLSSLLSPSHLFMIPDPYSRLPHSYTNFSVYRFC
jgi:hypothetical protein